MGFGCYTCHSEPKNFMDDAPVTEFSSSPPLTAERAASLLSKITDRLES